MNLKNKVLSTFLGIAVGLGINSNQTKADPLEISLASPVHLYDIDGVTPLDPTTTYLNEGQIIDFDLHVYTEMGERSIQEVTGSLDEPSNIEVEASLLEILNDNEILYNVHLQVEPPEAMQGQHDVLGAVFADYMIDGEYTIINDSVYVGTYNFNVVPEPVSLGLLGSGALTLLSRNRNSMRKKIK